MNLTPVEVAQRWHTAISTLAHWRVQGCGPKYIKFGRKVLYPLAEIEAFEKSRLMVATSVRSEALPQP